MKVTSFSIPTSPMNSIDFPTVLTTIFVIVDDWYQKTHQTDRNHLPGALASNE